MSGLNGELYWFFAVCPLGYHWGATAVQMSAFLVIIDQLLRHISGLVGDDRVLLVKFDRGPEFMTEAALQIF